jgi:hypothetical protein
MEVHAGEGGTDAQDWTDLRRTTDLLGYRPYQRAAAHGWIRCATDTGASPTVPAGTRVQAPGTPARAAQTYEVAASTGLRADWANLTVTGVPVPEPPPGSALRFLADPGFAPPDRVLPSPSCPVHVPPPGHRVAEAWILTHLGAATHGRGTVTVRRADDSGALFRSRWTPVLGRLPHPPAGTMRRLPVRARDSDVAYLAGEKISAVPIRTAASGSTAATAISPTMPRPTRPRSAETGCHRRRQRQPWPA